MAEVELIFEGNQYWVESASPYPGRPYVIFFQAYGTKTANAAHALKDQPGIRFQPHIRRVSLANDINVLSVFPRVSDWYQRPEMEEVVKAILAKTEGCERIGYGQSMGGYGVLNWYHELKLDHCVVVSPNASCTRSVIAFDNRMPGVEGDLERKGIQPERDRLLTGKVITNGYVLFDPYCMDGRHSKLILAKHKLYPIPVAFGGHSPVALLKELGIAEDWLIGMLQRKKFDLRAFQKEVAKRRSESGEFWFHVAETMKDHKWYKAAVKAARRAVKYKKNFVQGQGILAEMLCKTGEPAKALEILQPMADQVKNRERALLILAEQYPDVRDRSVKAAFLKVLKTVPGGDQALEHVAEEAAKRGQKIKLPKAGGGFFGGLMAKVFG